MSAQDQMRSMLDELMGTARDGPDANRNRVRFSDPRVCKSFLLGCCPHDTLQGTRMDIGDCSKIHDLALRADYEMATKDKEYYYEIDAMEHVEEFIKDCDNRTELAKQRLKETQEELSAEAAAKLDKVHEIAELIGHTLARAEELGAEGNVEESLKMMEEVEELKKNKQEAENDYRQSMPASNYQQQKLRVCEVCSAYLGIHDNDRRLADHFGGKLHLGFIQIREKLEELRKVVTEKREKRELERAQRRVEREKEDEERREKAGRDRERDRERNQDRDRYRERDRDRDRERERDRDRDRDRDRYRGDRDRYRDRERDRGRGRDRYREDRERDGHGREREHRHHSPALEDGEHRDRGRSGSSKRSRSRSKSQSHRERTGSDEDRC